MVRDVGTGSTAGDRGNLDGTKEAVRPEGDLAGEEGIDVVAGDGEFQRSGTVGRIDLVVMPAQHAGVGIVLVDAVDLVDVGRGGRAEGQDDVDVVEDHIGTVELEFDVDVDDAAGAIVLGPAVDGKGGGILPGVGPAEDTDGTADGEALAALEGKGAIGLVSWLVDLGMGGEGEGGGLAVEQGLVDHDDGGGAGIGIGREGEGTLDVAGFDAALAVHLARYLLLERHDEGDGRCRDGRRGGGRTQSKSEGISRRRGLAEAKVVLGGHGGHEVVLLLADPAELHALGHDLGLVVDGRGRLGGLGVPILVPAGRRGTAAHTTSGASAAVEAGGKSRGRGGEPTGPGTARPPASAAEALHLTGSHAAPAAHPRPTGALHKVLADLLHLPFLDVLGPLLHLLLGGGLLGLLDHLVHLLLVGVHEEVGPDGAQADLLAVSAGGQHLVEGKDELEGVLVDGLLVDGTGHVGDDLGQQTEGAQIFHDVAGLGGNEEQKQIILQRLVHIADRLGFHVGVLFGVPDQLGEGGQQTLDAHAVHLDELS